MHILQDITKLREDLITMLPQLGYAGGSHASLDYPEFDLRPFDFLNFAEQELQKNSIENRINCVAHLKRAIDCELDTFFSVLNLHKIIHERNLKFEKKIDLVKSMGLISPRSLMKLNSIRNKLEHEYTSPNINDLELYFDLCTAFVNVIEGYIFILSVHASMDWENTNDNENSLSIIYDHEKRTLIFQIGRWNDDKPEKIYRFTPDRKEDFAWAFKFYFLLCRATSLLSLEFVVEELKKEIIN